MEKIKELQNKLVYKKQNFWKISDKETHKSAFDFAEGYKDYLDNCKTERETVTFTEKIVKEKNFVELTDNNDSKKVYKTSHGKNIAIAIIGKKPISEGVNIVASHVDAPRVDLKQSPLFEDKTSSLGMFKTHYYGGIKKYQWMSTPLALHGIVIKNNGEKVNITIGEDKDDPIFMMPDLLPHLAGKEQYSKKIGDAVDASKMNAIATSIPFIDFDNEEEKNEITDALKLNALYILHEKYGITEHDFLSAEIQLVPAGKARDTGLDRAMVAAYGQDDRICAYTSLKALLELGDEQPEKTAIVFLTDKEEVGSDGNTGAKSIFLYDFVGDLLKYNNENYDSYTLRKTIINTNILSADVNAAINPNFPSVHEKENAVLIGHGVSLTKYTGARGKSGSNDANAEFMAKIIKIFDDECVNWQIGSLGKVDEGGGGTIAKFLAEQGANVIDCGTGLLGMHALYEICSKADLFSTYKAYNAFLKKG